MRKGTYASICIIMLAALLAAPASAEIIPVRGAPPGIKRDPNSDRNIEVYGIDSKTGEFQWIVLRRLEANFMEVFPEGALIGFDDGALMLPRRSPPMCSCFRKASEAALAAIR